MKRNVSLEDISDGKLYELNDMVKADCNDCKGCSSCCEGMGKSIILDPYDVNILSNELGLKFQELLDSHIELNVVDGIILPNLKMDDNTDKCTFLDDNGRCSIHAFRPGMCRLFPLGRFYENGNFKYFLQVNECKNNSRSKVKVKKWLDMQDVIKHEKYINEWHNFLLNLENKIENGDEVMSKEISMYVLNNFFVSDFGENFYDKFTEKIKNAIKMYG